tara:strand:- start:42 stop:215 length:174 start_codon:yes stop_codon:yes gene_type:complete
MKIDKLKEKMALDFFLEDLRTTNVTVRCRAKEFECENELNYWRDKVIDYLMTERTSL